MRTHRTDRREHRGVTLVECALVYPLALLLLAGMVVTSIGVFRYQQVASLAREAARWAAVRGPTYQSEQGGTAPDGATLKSQVIATRMAGMREDDLECSAVYSDNTVSVTLTYRWSTGFLPGILTLRSTAVAPITY